MTTIEITGHAHSEAQAKLRFPVVQLSTPFLKLSPQRLTSTSSWTTPRWNKRTGLGALQESRLALCPSSP